MLLWPEISKREKKKKKLCFHISEKIKKTKSYHQQSESNVIKAF